jgi:hypothetical protein
MDDPRKLGITCMFTISFYLLYTGGSILETSPSMELITSFYVFSLKFFELVSNGLSIDFKCAVR